MQSTYTCNYLPQSTSARIASMIDSGLIDISSINNKPDRREAGYVQQFIREYIDSKKSK